jgi:3-phosphoshikimate 1-carboxyvinyltransferase
MPDTPRIDYLVEAGGPLTGTAQLPGDKSISHRALMLGAVATGITQIHGFLDGEDTLATLAAFRALGVHIDYRRPRRVTVHGVGLHGLKDARAPLYLGNSGTSVRLLAGLLAGQEFDSELNGDASLQSRPMRRITEPLQRMGAAIRCSDQGTLPITIKGGRKLSGISYQMPVASAQLKSALLLAGLYAAGSTCVTEPAVTRDHTERMLAHFGCPVQRTDHRICITSGVLRGAEVQVPADISSAAFFMVGASIAAGSDVVLERVGVNPTRSAVIDILQAMGADIRLENRRDLGTEPVADIRVKYAKLRGIEIPSGKVSIAIDEFPVLFVAAACAEGRTVLEGAAELRVKESDRIAAMEQGLSALGVRVQARDDGMIIDGGALLGGTIDSRGDHRIAMAFAIAALAAQGPVCIHDCANIDTSFPGFAGLLRELGTPVTIAGDTVG